MNEYPFMGEFTTKRADGEQNTKKTIEEENETKKKIVKML